MKFELRKTARGLSDEDLLADMRRVAQDLGCDTVTLAEYTQNGLGHGSTIQRRFGSWFKALERAGLQPSRSPLGIADEALFENLQMVWTELRRQPSYTEVRTPLSQYSAGTYENRFGSWSNALRLFVEWVNADASSEPNAQQMQEAPTRPLTISQRRTKREVSERMRFRILVRDGFMCRACGASPLKSPGTDLHVDHVIPWSKGGETIENNLETKCSRCNLGKGNAFAV
jgi:5-methylcytosine-specific restriction endonuclease McrA